jgi:hypothetical protein
VRIVGPLFVGPGFSVRELLGPCVYVFADGPLPGNDLALRSAFWQEDAGKRWPEQVSLSSELENLSGIENSSPASSITLMASAL